MLEPFKYGPANLYLNPIWVPLPSDSEVEILIRPLSHRDISSSQEIHYTTSQNGNYTNPQTYRSLLIPNVMEARNIIGFPSVGDLIKQLPNDDITYLYERLLEVSVVSREQLDELGTMLDIQFNPQFSDDSWNCTICQEKKLDWARGCGYLPEGKRDPKPFLPRIGTRVFTQCPISTLDPYVTNQASMAHSIMESGLLPENGGVGNQTEWFVRSALLYKRKIAEAERNAMEAHKTK